MSNALFKTLAWLAFAAVLCATLVPIEYRPGDLLPVDMDRMLASAMMAGLFTLAYPRHIVLVGIVMVSGAALIEALQFLTATRHANLDDAVVKSFGAILGVGMGWVVNELRMHAASRVRKPRLVHSTPRQKSNMPTAAHPAPALPVGMKEIPVTSSMIQSIFFSPEDGKLHIRMQGGQVRVFEGVPEIEAMAIAAAKSPGQYYIDNIRSNFRRLAA